MRYPTEAACSIFLNSKADMSKKERPWTCVHDLFYFIFINETTGYRTFCVFFNANGASVYRASLAFIFSEMIFEGGQKVL